MKEIFKKVYSDESLYSLGRDIEEAIDENYNPVMGIIAEDEDGFRQGIFTVTIQWSNDG